MRTQRLLVPLLAALIASATGCASFPQNELPKRGPGSIDPAADWPAIDYELSFSVMDDPSPEGIENLDERVQSVFGASGAFAGFGPGLGGESHHLRLSLDHRRNTRLAPASALMSGLTFMIVPDYAKDEYTLIAEVSRGARVLKRYRYNDSMGTWFQSLLVFATPFYFPSNVEGDIIDNMLWNLLADFEQDGIFEQAPLDSGEE